MDDIEIKGTTGASMFPAILEGARLAVSPTHPKDIRIGDVLCYPGHHLTVVAHRVVRIEKEDGKRVFVTRGDSQSTLERVEETAAIGVVTKVIYPLWFYKTSGTLGQLLAKMAVCEGVRWHMARAWTTVLFKSARWVVRRLA